MSEYVSNRSCVNCAGSGEQRGKGMMGFDKCSLCFPIPIPKKEIEINKETKEYKKAIYEIMKADKSLSKDEAEEYFAKELNV